MIMSWKIGEVGFIMHSYGWWQIALFCRHKAWTKTNLTLQTV